jgi:hypothetical protein
VKGVSNAGAAYVFVKPSAGWGDMTQTAVLTASNPENGADFGISVTIDGDTIVVGAASLAYVFVRPTAGWTNMTETAQLTASDVTSDLGASLQINGDTIVAGAPFKQPGGAVYVFVKPTSGWTSMTETAELNASDTAYGDFLGNGVGISGNVIVGGAPAYGNLDPTGAAYVFVEPPTGWANMTETAKLTSSNGGGRDYFGTSVAVGNGLIVVGAIEASVGSAKDVGAAYVFVKPTSGWSSGTQTAILTPSFPGSEFGISAAINGDAVLVTDIGAAFIFVPTPRGWKNTTKYVDELYPSVGVGNFGFSVGISGHAVVGSGPGNMYAAGAAVVFGP